MGPKKKPISKKDAKKDPKKVPDNKYYVHDGSAQIVMVLETWISGSGRTMENLIRQVEHPFPIQYLPNF